MSDLEVEVRRLIHISFNDYPNEWISSEKLIRIWSLDLQWVDSNDAQKLLESLIKTGWLQIKDNSVKPIESLYSLDIPIGWNPMVRRMIDGVDFIPSEAESINEKQLITSNPIVESSNVSSFVEDNPSTPNDRFVDPMIQKISEIRSHIATVSGLEIREIQRRAQRKRKACMPMTLWMALLLVGREQRIDISLFL
ncbi:MAG: DUF2240 family protein [Candidatus Thalassarchaeaceae archaeon]|tara:strand:- start:4123 stop:4707 length:585 start_codon:yes stop_codon:yes gene_type:complete